MPDMPHRYLKSLIKNTVRVTPLFPFGLSIPLDKRQKRMGCLKLPV